MSLCCIHLCLCVFVAFTYLYVFCLCRIHLCHVFLKHSPLSYTHLQHQPKDLNSPSALQRCLICVCRIHPRPICMFSIHLCLIYLFTIHQCCMCLLSIHLCLMRFCCIYSYLICLFSIHPRLIWHISEEGGDLESMSLFLDFQHFRVTRMVFV